MVGQATRSRRRSDVTCATDSCGARETERDRLCGSDAGEIDAAEGGPAHNAGGAVYPCCIKKLVAFVCWSLRRLCARVESHGRRSSLLCPTTYTPLRRGGWCVRACNNTDHSNTSTRLKYHQQYLRLVHMSPGVRLQQRAVLTVGRTSFPSNFAH